MTLRRAATLLLGAVLIAALIAAPSGAAGSGSSPLASAAKKKCKKKGKKASVAKKKKCKKKHAAKPTPPAPAKLAMDPLGVDYGAVGLGAATYPTQEFTLSNVGGTNTAALSAAVSGPNADQFPGQNDNCSGRALTPGSSCTVQVKFVPTSYGAKTAQLNVGAGGPALGATLSGNGSIPSTLYFSPPSHNYGSVVALSASPPTSVFTLYNTGGLPAAGVSIGFTGADASQFSITTNTCGPILLPFSSCDVTVAFAPNSAAAAPKTANLNAGDVVGDSASATVTGIATGLTISPSPFNFGTTASGVGVTQTFTVTNTDAAPSGLLGLPAYGGANASDYSTALLGNTCTGFAVLGSGGTCTFNAVFNPVAGGGVRSSSGTVTIGASPGGNARAVLSGMKSP